MTIYYDPVEDDTDPDTINVWHVSDDGTKTDIGSVDVSGVNGMPDILGGICPNEVRIAVAEYYLNTLEIQVLRDHMAIDYKLGSPP